MKRTDQTAQIIGQYIGPNGTALYRLVSLLGQQTGRRTFLAVDTRTQQKVVVKLLLFGPDFTWDDLKLFEREAETLKALEHLAIPRYLNSFEVETLLGEGFALVQTYIEAKSLQDWVVGGYRFSEQELKIIAGALLAILQYLHSRHPAVVHRDIKPSNVLLSERMGRAPGRVYLVDFGSVQATSQGATMTVVGTYGYMPPEQFGGRAQPASDLYGLGATLIYLSSGQHPAELPQLNMQIAFEEHTRFSPSFSRWVRQLTYADLAQRTSSATEAIQQLNATTAEAKVSLKHSDVVNSQREASTPQHGKISLSDHTLSLPQKYNDFIISLGDRDMEITFLRARIQKDQSVETLPQYLAIVFTLFFILVALAFWIGEPAIFIAGLLVAILLFPNKKDKTYEQQGLSSLKIVLSHEGSMMMSLNQTGSVSSFIEPDPMLTYLPLRYISVDEIAGRPNQFVNFHFIHNDGRGNGQIHLRASRSEVRWLCDHLSQWKDVPVQWNR